MNEAVENLGIAECCVVLYRRDMRIINRQSSIIKAGAQYQEGKRKRSIISGGNNQKEGD
jgi:hypothetical protein